jgi:hypothetical protein
MSPIEMAITTEQIDYSTSITHSTAEKAIAAPPLAPAIHVEPDHLPEPVKSDALKPDDAAPIPLSVLYHLRDSKRRHAAGKRYVASTEGVAPEEDLARVTNWLKNRGLTLDALPSDFWKHVYEKRSAILRDIATDLNEQKRVDKRRAALVKKWALPADFFDRSPDEQTRLRGAARTRLGRANRKARAIAAPAEIPPEMVTAMNALEIPEPLTGAERMKRCRAKLSEADRERAREADRERKRQKRSPLAPECP